MHHTIQLSVEKHREDHYTFSRIMKDLNLNLGLERLIHNRYV